MSDNNGEPRDGKDDCIVCYGHDKKAKITALAFQPGGNLLVGEEDCLQSCDAYLGGMFCSA